jgi:chemotaxis protein MotA
LGHSIGGALVGTFFGILLSYGFVGPLGKMLERQADEHRSYLDTIRVAFVSFTAGAHQNVATEFGRRVVPPSVRPSFQELEAAIRKRAKKAKKDE